MGVLRGAGCCGRAGADVRGRETRAQLGAGVSETRALRVRGRETSHNVAGVGDPSHRTMLSLRGSPTPHRGCCARVSRPRTGRTALWRG